DLPRARRPPPAPPLLMPGIDGKASGASRDTPLSQETFHRGMSSSDPRMARGSGRRVETPRRSSMRLRRSLPLAGCLLALAASPLMAEPLTGTVVGPDDRPVARASVVLARPAGGVLQAHTDEEGRFAVDVA